MSASNKDTANKPEYTLGATSYKSDIELKLINVLYDTNNNPCTAVYAEVIMGNIQNERIASIAKKRLGYCFSYMGTTFYLKEFN